MGIALDDISPMCKACENTNGQPNGECLNKCGAAVKKLREEYERAYNQLAQAHPYTLGSFHLNLTTNWCGDGYSPLPFVLEQQNSHTADGYFEEFSKLIADENIRGEFFARFNRTALLEAFARGERAASIEYPILYADGNRYWREGRLYMIQNPVTGDVEAVTYALDINEKKKTADIINLITQGEFDYIGVIYLNTRSFEFFNKKSNIAYPAAHEIVSYDRCCEYVRANFVDAEERTQFDAAVNIDSIVAGLEKNGRYASSYRRTENGVVSRRQLQYSWLDKQCGEVLVVRTDVTAAYAQEQAQLEEVRQALARAEEANRAKTDFVSRISHDIRTPISAITSMIAFAREDADDREKLMKDLDAIQASSAFLLSLINDVLDISKVDSGKIELDPQPYPYEEYIASVRSIFDPLCCQNGIVFSVENGCNCGCAVVDRVRFNQITLNILSNAVKYTRPGGAIVYRSDSRPLPGGMMECGYTITDNGIGMSREFQKTMFEPFSQEHDNPDRPGTAGGTGLGLAIVKKLVELMKGTIRVESELGKGTRVSVRFIVPAADAEQLEKYRGSAPGAGAAVKKALGGKVLLAEDNAINTVIAVRLLKKFGYNAQVAENGIKAVEMFCASAPGEYAAVLMDIQMPVMDGIEATRRIRALERPDAGSVPIIALTADAFADAMERGRASGMNAYLTKPLDPAVLERTLAQFTQPAANRQE